MSAPLHVAPTRFAVTDSGDMEVGTLERHGTTWMFHSKAGMMLTDAELRCITARVAQLNRTERRQNGAAPCG